MAPRRAGPRRAAAASRHRRRASRRAIRTRRTALGAALVGAAIAGSVLALAGGGAGSGPVTASAGTTRTSPPSPRSSASTTASSSSPSSSARTTTTATLTTRARVAPAVLVAPAAAPGTAWSVVAWVHGHPAAWLAQRRGVTLIRFDQRYVHLTLHAGSVDGGAGGWRYGDQITAGEIHHLVAAFNGGFKLTYRDVGFVSAGRVAVPLSPGLASIVTYTDGTTGVGAWNEGVPTRRKTVYSVLQNQQLLLDRGAPAPTVSACITACWGATIQGLTTVARSAVGVRADGELVWAAGEQLTPATLAAALVGVGVVRAVELDINPDWVDGYLYTHHATGPIAVPALPGQLGIAGQFLSPYTRDFFAVVAD